MDDIFFCSVFRYRNPCRAVLKNALDRWSVVLFGHLNNAPSDIVKYYQCNVQPPYKIVKLMVIIVAARNVCSWLFLWHWKLIHYSNFKVYLFSKKKDYSMEELQDRDYQRHPADREFNFLFHEGDPIRSTSKRLPESTWISSWISLMPPCM